MQNYTAIILQERLFKRIDIYSVSGDTKYLQCQENKFDICLQD